MPARMQAEKNVPEEDEDEESGLTKNDGDQDIGATVSAKNDHSGSLPVKAPSQSAKDASGKKRDAHKTVSRYHIPISCNILMFPCRGADSRAFSSLVYVLSSTSSFI